jgi:hypothetical protein
LFSVAGNLQFAMIRLLKTSSVGISVLKPGKKCSAHGHIDDLLPDASRKRVERLILASKRSWAKWPRSGKGSLRRRRAKKMNTILAVPRQTPATNEPSQAFASAGGLVRIEGPQASRGGDKMRFWLTKARFDAATEADRALVSRTQARGVRSTAAATRFT